jgi:hypothetical protein
MSIAIDQDQSLRTQVLNYAAYLIEEFGWCQFAPARDECGILCMPQDERAVSFCLTGAVERAIFDLMDGWDIRASGIPPEIRIRKNNDPGKSPALDPNWNNAPERTRDEVVARLRERASMNP